ncbi:sugar porter family MFS transporter [Aspergillus stella-maris]|uniref:sugar porter family MFS transporter n=1 Tax=Aspergillus stella-maris TaxID=1810926 RepID=UPI003CCD45A2
MSLLVKNSRLLVLAAVAYTGSFLFGYDTGVMGSVLALDSFKEDFNLPTGSTGFASSREAEISSNVVALLTAGCFFGAIAASFANDRYGRRYSLIVLTVIFMIGAAVQTGGKGTIAYMYGGRVIAGFGIGGMSAITPVYVAENCPPNVRGRIAGLFQEFLVIGVTVSYWLCYGVEKNIAPSTRQWRVPVAFQLVPSGLMFIGLWFLKESPRWLMKQGRLEEATASLAYTRRADPDSEEVRLELSDIKASIEEELASTEGVTWREILLPGNRLRFLNAFLIMFWQQFSGTNSIGYYAPQLFQTIGVASTDTSLFTTGIYGIVKVVATGTFLLIGIDKVGRKWSLVVGGFWMAAMMFVLGAVLVSYPPVDTSSVSSASIAMIVMVYLYVTGYSASWGPIPWVYISEIFPTRLRAYGVGMGSATQWLFNFVVTKFTPSAISNIGWRTFIMFGVFCAAMGLWALLCIKETKGRSLEDMDALFGGHIQQASAKDVETAGAEQDGDKDARARHEEQVVR